MSSLGAITASTQKNTPPPGPTIPPELASIQTSDIDAFNALQTALKDLHEKPIQSCAKQVTALEVTSWAQVPRIIQLLQQGSSLELKLVFPEPTGPDAAQNALIKKEQEAIHDFMSTHHSKPLPDMFQLLEKNLETSWIWPTATIAANKAAGFAVLWMASFKLNNADTDLLTTTHVVDISKIKGTAPDKQAIQDQIVSRAPKSASAPGILFEVPDKPGFQKALQRFIDDYNQPGTNPPIGDARVWTIKTTQMNGNPVPVVTKDVPLNDFLTSAPPPKKKTPPLPLPSSQPGIFMKIAKFCFGKSN